MTERVVFYLLDTATTIKARNLMACRLIEKLYHSGEKILVYAGDDETASDFDQQLWTFRDISFVPHQIALAVTDDFPVVISCKIEIPQKATILVNLTSCVVQNYQYFPQVVELVLADELSRQAARTKYRAYRDEGLEIENFKI